MTFKKALLFTHRWLGFISGLVVFIVSITGCIFCFQDEIQDALHSYRRVEQQDKPYLAPSVLKQNAIKLYPGATAGYIYYYGKNRPATVIVNNNSFVYVYLNPFTGAVTHTENPLKNFFTIVEYIHLYLLLPPKIGTMVVGISVIVFLVMMVTGIVLWWPKRKTDRKRAFTVKWNGRWRRVNYDLHNVLGFYVTGIAIILAISGLAIAFKWVNSAIYRTVNLGHYYAKEKTAPTSERLNAVLPGLPVIDKAFAFAQQQSVNAQMFLLYDDPAVNGTVTVTAYAKSLNYGFSDFYFFDKYTGKLLRYLPNIKKSAGQKINDMNYDIHVGQALGLPGKIIAFAASLVCASLPITGFIIWLGKRNKKRYKKPDTKAMPKGR